MFKDCRKKIFNLSIVLVMVATVGMVATLYINESVSKGWFLADGHIKFLFTLFVLMFLIFYILLVIHAILKQSIKKTVCRATNFKILILSVVLFYPLSWQVDRVNIMKDEMEILLNSESEMQCLNPESPLSILDKIVTESYALLCSHDCPCSGNPMIFK